jgi:hypothetical protein
MTEICVGCGDASSDEVEGRYVEFDAVDEGAKVCIERWVCEECYGGEWS